MKILAKLFLTAAGLLFIAWLLPGVVVESFYIALIVAVLLGLINVTLKPLLVLLTLPINILTLGLFVFVINGFLFWLLTTFIEGFDVVNFGAALLASLILSFITMLAERFLDAVE